jgi:hypothetical protein
MDRFRSTWLDGCPDRSGCPLIHVLSCAYTQDVNARDTRGHDETNNYA